MEAKRPRRNVKSRGFFVFLIVVTLAFVNTSVVSIAASSDEVFLTNGFRYFDVNGDDRVTAIGVTASGRILALINSHRTSTLVQMNSDGTLDSSFGNQGIVTFAGESVGNADAIHVLDDGKIIVANSACIACFTRLLANGMTDNTFGSNGILNLTAVSNHSSTNGHFLLSPRWSSIDNAFVVLQRWVSGGGLNHGFTIKKFDSQGLLVQSFGTDGTYFLGTQFTYGGYVNDWLIMPDGRIVISAGAIGDNGKRVVQLNRLLSNGIQDSSFDSDSFVRVSMGVVNLDFRAMESLESGELVVAVACRKASSDFCFTKVKSNGATETNFGSNGWVDPGRTLFNSDRIFVDEANRIYFVEQNSFSGLSIWRYSSTGALDTSYGFSNPGTELRVNIPMTPLAGTFDSFGRFLVGGAVSVALGVVDGVVLRLRPDGYLSSTTSTTHVSTSTTQVSSSTTEGPKESRGLVTTGPNSKLQIALKKSISVQKLLLNAGIRVTAGSRVSAVVVGKSQKICRISRSSLVTVKRGVCTVKLVVWRGSKIRVARQLSYRIV